MREKACRAKMRQHLKLSGLQKEGRGLGGLDSGQMGREGAVARREEAAAKKGRLLRGTWRAAMGQDGGCWL